MSVTTLFTDSVIAAVIGALGVVVVTVMGIWAAARLGIGKLNDELVKTLQATVQAKDSRIADLERELATEREARKSLEKRVRALESAIADLTMRGARRRPLRAVAPREQQEVETA